MERRSLNAEGTVCIGDPAVAFDIDGGPGTGTGHIPDAKALHFIADLDAAHAFDALFRVADEWKALIPRRMLHTLFEGQINDVQVVGKCLQGTVAAADAGCALEVVLGQDQLYILFSCHTDLWTVSQDLKAFLHLVVAGGHQLFFAGDLYETDAAGRNLIDVF